MISDNLLDTIIIDDPMLRIQLIDGGNIIDVFKSRELRSIIGEKDMINKALKKFNGKRKDASEELGISERTLYRKIKQYGLDT